MAKKKWIIILHLFLFLLSLTNVMSKLAAKSKFMSFRFMVCYGLVLVFLAIYAVGWQQIIKHLNLSLAYANKAITVIWGLVWGILLFDEELSAGKCIGIVVIIIGVLMFTYPKGSNSVE